METETLEESDDGIVELAPQKPEVPTITPVVVSVDENGPWVPPREGEMLYHTHAWGYQTTLDYKPFSGEADVIPLRNKGNWYLPKEKWDLKLPKLKEGVFGFWSNSTSVPQTCNGNEFVLRVGSRYVEDEHGAVFWLKREMAPLSLQTFKSYVTAGKRRPKVDGVRPTKANLDAEIHDLNYHTRRRDQTLVDITLLERAREVLLSADAEAFKTVVEKLPDESWRLAEYERTIKTKKERIERLQAALAPRQRMKKGYMANAMTVASDIPGVSFFERDGKMVIRWDKDLFIPDCPINYNGIELEVDRHNSRRGYAFSVRAHHNEWLSFYHPHLGSNSSCLGGFNDVLAAAFGEANLPAVVTVLEKVITSYNPDSPLTRLDNVIESHIDMLKDQKESYEKYFKI